MFTEDELLPLSALQHLLFCERQCALIHVEQVWTENRLTVEGRILHERVDEVGSRPGADMRVSYGLPLRSLQLGLSGKADVVEFHRDGELWRPFPVEYKHGRPKKDGSDRVQLCAQALCLEEMLVTGVEGGALFYGRTRRREDVCFDEDLRRLTRETAGRLHELVAAGVTPAAQYRTCCRNCSLQEICLPRSTGRRDRVARYVDRMVDET